ncbi:MAG: helix-turn-helix transcriptional regulator [Alphaproteobacteria bacterium]|nr:helix-turn-helix transcriptional regulator [Alphaproteobacteria bacterium]
MAERLFATRGIHDVMVKDVNEAAGQKNKSAIHYHFGGKGDLLIAIFAFRFEQTEAAANEALDRLLEQTPAPSPHAVIEAVWRAIIPFVESPKDWYWARLAAANMFYVNVAYEPFVHAMAMRWVKRVIALLVQACPGLPEPLVTMRVRNFLFFLTALNGEWARRLHVARPRLSAHEFRAIFADAVASTTAMLTAPAQESAPGEQAPRPPTPRRDRA